MSNHKLYKNVYLEKIRSVVQYIVMSQTDLTLKFVHQQINFRCGVGTSKHNCLLICFIRLTTCFGHCGPSSGHKNV